MSENIIIDGVNVAKCENLEQNNACNEYLDGCCEGHNCLYKQLQRAKAENEKLKAMAGVYSVRLMEKYKQALEDIRDMAKHDCEYECSNDYTVCKIESCLEQRIMRKINEVLKWKIIG